MRKEIDINKWSRKKSYDTFENFDDPYTGITTTLNITKIVYLAKNTNNSFYWTMLYFILMTMDEIDAYKYGYGKDKESNIKIYKYDDIAAAATVLNSNNILNFT